MNLTEMMNEMRYELQEETGALYSATDLTRAITKSVSLMSRLIPKRAVVETTITRTIANETLTIASTTGTLAHNPIKPDSLVITGKTLDTDYTVNYLTGVVTGVSATLLPDTTYTANYDLDSNMLDISTLLPEEDYIKIDRIEYPVGNNPPTYITYEIFGEFLLIKGTVDLTKNNHLRIIHLKPWTTPTVSTDGDYPEHLDNAIIIGSVGQALIFKAEKYVREAVAALSALTAPTLHVYTEIGAPSLPDAPSAPTAPSPSYTDVQAALDKIATLADTEVGIIADALALLATGAGGGLDYIITINDAERVAENYALYANTKLEVAKTYISRAITDLRNQEDVIALHAQEVAKYGSEVNSYANEMSGTVGKYREQLEGQKAAIAANNAMVSKYIAQAGEQEMKARNLLSIAGRYLSSGQAKVNEMLIMLGVKPEFFMYKGSSEQFA